MKPKTLFYGGSFDPIHNGHLLTAQYVGEKYKFDKVVLVPTNNPLKTSETPYLTRLEMCRLATAEHPLIEVSNVELELNEISQKENPETPQRNYTINTVKHLKNMGYNEVNWLVGTDCMYELHKWHRWEELLANVNLFVAERNEPMNWGMVDSKIFNFTVNAELEGISNIIIVNTPKCDISSTQIRERSKNHQHIGYFVPSVIEQYILLSNLYGIKEPITEERMERLRKSLSGE